MRATGWFLAAWMAIVVGAGWASHAGAQEEAGTKGGPEPAGASLIKFIPDGYRFLYDVYGDLNGDGVDDCVFIIQATDKKNFVRRHEDDPKSEIVNRNRCGIMIFFKDGDDYRLVLQNRKIFASEEEDGGVYYAPELYIEIEKGNLYIKYSHGRYGAWSYTFRYRKSEFELIGYDNYESYYDGIISINFLTKKLLKKDCIRKDNEEPCGGRYGCCSEVRKETWKDLKDILTIKEPIILRKIADIQDIGVYKLLRDGWADK